MLRTALPARSLPSTTGSCTCKRAASTVPTPLQTSSSPPPPPLPSVYAQQTPTPLPIASDNPHWTDPRYLARYRNPKQHDATRGSLETFAKPKDRSTAAAAPLETPPQRPPRSRENRLEMERLWSGGDFSPPIPVESYKTQTTRPSTALLYPGSGSQYVGMGAFLREGAGAAVWEEAEEALETFEAWRRGLRLHEMEGELGELGRILDSTEEARSREDSLRKIVFEGPQNELTRSANAQPAILITSIAFTRALERKHGVPIASTASLVLGHSSGEYTSAVAAGALSLGDGVRLMRLHGLLTESALSLPSIGLSPDLNAPSATRGQMSALVMNPGHTHQELTDVIRRIRSERPTQRGSEGTVEVASFNSLTQVVLAGSRDGILRASEVLRELGIANRAADLPVSAPFHCSFMKPAALCMEAALNSPSIRIHTPSSPLVSGLDASLITTPSSLIHNLVKQISDPVRWSTCINSLSAKHNIQRLCFLGPGKALANLARKDFKMISEAAVAAGKEVEHETEVVSVATEKEMEALAERWADEDGA